MLGGGGFAVGGGGAASGMLDVDLEAGLGITLVPLPGDIVRVQTNLAAGTGITLTPGAGTLLTISADVTNWTQNVNANYNDLTNVGCIVFRQAAGDPAVSLCSDAQGRLVVSDNGNTARIWITQTGHIGIGTNNPAYPLDVTGNIRATGCVYLGTTPNLVSLCHDNNGELLINGKEIHEYCKPAGVDHEVQFNDNGHFGAHSGLKYFENFSELDIGTVDIYGGTGGEASISTSDRLLIESFGLGPGIDIQSATGLSLQDGGEPVTIGGWTTPAYQLDVFGDINLRRPLMEGYAYRINGIPFAQPSNDNTQINLSNIATINGAAPGAAGANGQIQFNDNGSLGASAGLTWTMVPLALNILAMGGLELVTFSAGNATIANDTNKLQFTALELIHYSNTILFQSTGAQEEMRIIPGRIGIGTPTPQYTLDINATTEPAARVQNTTSGATVIVAGASGQYSAIELHVGTAFVNCSIYQLGDNKLRVWGYESVAVGPLLKDEPQYPIRYPVHLLASLALSWPSVAWHSSVAPVGINLFIDNELVYGVGTNYVGWMQFRGGNDPKPPFVLNPAGGNVGIGMMTPPQYTLDVNGNIGCNGDIVITNLNNDFTLMGAFGQRGVLAYWAYDIGTFVLDTQYGTSGIESANLWLNAQTLFLQKENTIVAIGYNRASDGMLLGTPQYTLDVNGDIRALGDIIADNLPQAHPGVGSKKFWCDPADGHAVKFAV